MQIAAWPAKWLVRIWAVGVTAEILLLLALRVASAGSPIAEKGPDLKRIEQQQTSSTAGELSPAQRDSLLKMLRDSLGVTVTRGAKGIEVHGPPELEKAFGRTLNRIGDGVWYATVFAASIVLPIPLVLVCLTVLWIFARWREAPVSTRDSAA